MSRAGSLISAPTRGYVTSSPFSTRRLIALTTSATRLISRSSSSMISPRSASRTSRASIIARTRRDSASPTSRAPRAATVPRAPSSLRLSRTASFSSCRTSRSSMPKRVASISTWPARCTGLSRRARNGRTSFSASTFPFDRVRSTRFATSRARYSMYGSASSRRARYPSVPCSLTYRSGSFPGGSATTTTSKPFSSRTSRLRRVAARPAASGSKLTTTRSVYLFNSRTCPAVKPVPSVPTASVTPAWWRAMTSMYPSTRTACPCFRIASLASGRP